MGYKEGDGLETSGDRRAVFLTPLGHYESAKSIQVLTGIRSTLVISSITRALATLGEINSQMGRQLAEIGQSVEIPLLSLSRRSPSPKFPFRMALIRALQMRYRRGGVPRSTFHLRP